MSKEIEKVVWTGEITHDCKYNPEKNHKAISIIEQEDGNWKGWMWRWGKLIEVRQGDPLTVLNTLLTHE